MAVPTSHIRTTTDARARRGVTLAAMISHEVIMMRRALLRCVVALTISIPMFWFSPVSGEIASSKATSRPAGGVAKNMDGQGEARHPMPRKWTAWPTR